MIEKRNASYRQAATIALILGVLTVIEYFASQSPNFNSGTILFLIALVKGFLVLYFFMSVYRLWSQEEH